MSIRVKLQVICVLAVFIMTAATGCNDSCNGQSTETESAGYRTLTVTNELCSFAIEYSSFYERVGPRCDLDWKIPFMYVTLLAPEKQMPLVYPVNRDEVSTVTSTYVPASIEIDASDTRENYPERDAQFYLEEALKDWGKWENFELLERYPVIVSGVEGELIAYVVDWFLPVPKDDSPLLKYVREVYFDYNGLVWWIEAECELEMVDQVKADFEHILETFQILD